MCPVPRDKRSGVTRYTGSYKAMRRKDAAEWLATVGVKVQEFVDRWGLLPTALIVSPRVDYVAEMREAYPAMPLMYDAFCPNECVYPINLEALEHQRHAELLAQIERGHQAELHLQTLLKPAGLESPKAILMGMVARGEITEKEATAQHLAILRGMSGYMTPEQK